MNGEIGIDLTYIVIVLISVLISMTLHEAMHGFMSYWLGDDTAKLNGRLTLNPIKHIDPLLTLALPIFLAVVGAPIFGGAKPVPFNAHMVRFGEWGVALVAIAGPLTNLALAFIAFGITLNLDYASFASSFFTTFMYVNLGFFAFNVIPFPPLDGSRVLYALAPEFVRRAMEIIEQYGIILVFVIVMFMSSYIGQLMLAIITSIMKVFMQIYAVA